MTNANDFAFNDSATRLQSATPDGIEANNPPLTKREYFAAMRRPQEGESSLSKEVAEVIMGEKAPTKFNLESVKWWVSAEEKLSVLRADALINALNETEK